MAETERGCRGYTEQHVNQVQSGGTLPGTEIKLIVGSLNSGTYTVYLCDVNFLIMVVFCIFIGCGKSVLS